MKTRITRRRLLLAATGAAVTGLVGSTYFGTDYHEVLVSTIRTKLSYLKLEDGAPEAFARDFDADYGPFHVSLLQKLLGQQGVKTQVGAEDFDNIVVSRFLLSTDFFRNGSDESKPVRYLAYFDPYTGACGNPFADLG